MKLKTKRYEKSITSEKTFQFSIHIIRFSKTLIEQNEFVMSKQLVRSATSVGAMSREANNAESAKDFIHKLSIAQKEADESLYWIDLLYETDYMSTEKYEFLSSRAREIMRLITSSLVTMKKKVA